MHAAPAACWCDHILGCIAVLFRCLITRCSSHACSFPGVGFSTSDSKADYSTNDTQTAIDAHAFLRLFFKEFREFVDNDFYVTGESYAGIYVPNLVNAVVQVSCKHLC